MSSDNCSYISASLMCDPFDLPRGMKHVTGNIGRPGIVFLVPPTSPMIREPQRCNWQYLDNAPFGGMMKDSFTGTSLHVSFTGATSPISQPFSEAQDVEMCLLETLVSIHDKGEWMADLDIFKSLDSLKVQRLLQCQDQAYDSKNDTPITDHIIWVDNWYELLQPSKATLRLVRANGNWQARLAAVSLSAALGISTVIVSKGLCWVCLEKYHLSKRS
ncbi:MAG: hypothetical protein MMC33_009364 [Icmadophila ericetorum]|nr:hypothetical protein [Icmadophila ericetorum]